ncbi:TonB-dependent receptor plug domain-containing protein, partial [Candidatus Aerophobetes bacterium]|nr:TonB-dependent receptor plug domain-containing protein [Candidatus Aerophobetes bacterium]
MQKNVFVLWCLGFFLGGVLFPLSCVAGDEVFDLGELVITATRVPALLKDVPGSCTVIDEETIKSSKAKDLAEIIEKVAGVNVKTYSFTGISIPSIRGSFSGQVLVMVDGRPLNLASSGDVDLSLIPLENIKKIEVVRGPFSSLYGSGAVGGVINIITKTPADASRTELGFSYGSFNSPSLTFSHGESKDKFGYLFTMSGDFSDGDRENSWKNSSGFSGKVNFSSFVFSGGYSRTKRGIPGSLSWPSPNASQVDEKNWFDVSYNWQNQTPGLSLKAFLNQDRIIYEDPDWQTKDTTENTSSGANFQHTFSLLPGHEVILGI